MKAGVRILAVAAAPIKKRDTMLIGVVSRADTVEGILTTRVAVDGTDSTERIAEMLNGSRFKEQVRLIATNGIGLAGLNVLDMRRLEKLTGTKVLSVTRRKPHPAQLIKALRAFSRIEKKDVTVRITIVKGVTAVNNFRASGFYLQTTMAKADAGKFALKSVSLLRLAHLIASGIATGESSGRI